MRGLKDKVALVTGAASGIGLAIAKRLAEEGMVVGVLDINAEAAAKAVAEIKAAGGKAEAGICDITHYDAVKAAVAEIESKIGPTWALVNNAGWDKPIPFLKTTPDFWQKVVSINYMGPLHMTHAVVQGMVQRGGGRVIFIASDAGRVGSSGEVVYSGTKGATIAFSKALAREVSRKNVTLNCLCPGPTNTPAMDAFVGTGEEGQKIRDAMVRGVPLGRIGEPTDYPGLVAFLASDDASFMTGQVISVSGGLTMHG
ncbi:2-hydroxycyclohexanecarboxyl-CoA dehydrogenase [Panacagrimonas perspica]|uniref:2-hydroxycyclohexanecarboxyl-CoA dehydrogenase n=1 Tax=Panacagrimonas perspica TaxID=381431 RepID=A0A4R7P1Z2_9GAMM|nr:glucose 1-dehydrogenase [Panacagrimonas perspica]TDU26900.1 2-hydroxycyclohexanecarboxyl-CoA dehydrogenase [Panacagrimonas perspica]THD03667.1 2-hydroxycyclohexanecarboxyl-CoA dehydrogenase [Panacagrimonas perspica]